MYYTIGGELYHHGILGQKHGVRNGPPYPLGRGDHSAAERRQAKSGISTLSSYLKDRKRKKKQRQTLEKARATKAKNTAKKQSEEEREAAKQKALKSGSAADVLKFQGELTNQQLTDAINRLTSESKLKELSAKDIKTTTDKIDSIIGKIDKARGWTEKGISAYNTAAKIINAYSDEDSLPIIGEKKPSKSQKENDKLNAAIKKLTMENNELRNRGLELDNEKKKIENKDLKKTLKIKRKSLKKDKEKSS